MKNCKHCDKSLENKNKSAIFCSSEHKDLYWYTHNKEHAKNTAHIYESNNKEAIRERKRNYVNKRRSEDLNFRLASNMRARISRAVTKGFKHTTLSEYLGCTIEELKSHLMTKFESGMSWDNYGKWEIDHIYPLAKSNLTDPDVFAKVCHYTNLQPLWKLDNRVKKDMIYGKT
jgi:hypothetical protein